MISTLQTPREALAYQATIAPGNDDTVSSVAWTISPSGPTIGDPANTSVSSTVLVSGLEAGSTYVLACLITGASGAIYDGAISIVCVNHR